MEGGKTHLQARCSHACKRAQERYGLQLDATVLAKFRDRILDESEKLIQDCILLHKSRSNNLHYAMWYCGEWIPIVFDPTMNAVVTVLPTYYLRRHRRKLPW